jgi:UDPglucose--hexose-1-phosphate uridylyltransferase
MESHTPPAVFEWKDADGAWQLRVVPNKYPAVTRLGVAADSPTSIQDSDDPLGRQAMQPAWGAHEVIIESRRHVAWLSELAVEELCPVLEAYRQRLRFWRQDGRSKYGLIFKNAGASSGASLAHLHSQLVVLGEVPPDFAAELLRAKEYFHQNGACPFCEIVRAERAFGGRVVFDSESLLAICPYASLQPYETWIFPTDHQVAFEDCGEDDITLLAEMLLKIIRRIEHIAKPSGYNLLLRTAPWLPGIDPWCHWRIEILPRSTAFAGYELATGMAINHILPERAAECLRQLRVDKD